LAAISGIGQSTDWYIANRRVSDDAVARAKTWWIEKKEERAAVLLRQAKLLRSVGRQGAAAGRLRQIIETLPGTPSAEEARQLLAQAP
jgi:hypothetical protein